MKFNVYNSFSLKFNFTNKSLLVSLILSVPHLSLVNKYKKNLVFYHSSNTFLIKKKKKKKRVLQ